MIFNILLLAMGAVGMLAVLSLSRGGKHTATSSK